MKTTLAHLLLACAFALPAAAQPQPDAAATRQLHALFERYWEESAQRFPEWATWRGDQGAVPLPVLERIVDEWIAAQAAQ